MSVNASLAGIGLRSPHYQELIANPPDVGLMEVHSENFFCAGGPPWRYLNHFREHYPISVHGVGLSLGSADPVNPVHLEKLKTLIERVEPCLVSEHLCWTGIGGRYLNDLLPIPYTAEALDHVVAKVEQVQEYLGRQILVENVSSYLQYAESPIPEWEFLEMLANRSGCRILLDVNNIYVSSVNHQFAAKTFIDAINPKHVGEIHLAGYEDTGEILIDTHGNPVTEDVWTLYRHALQRTGPVPTIVEWDTDIPPLPILLAQAQRATACLAELS